LLAIKDAEFYIEFKDLNFQIKMAKKVVGAEKIFK
jgi:hypothetical protein